MMELLTEHWISLIFSLISVGALAYAKYISSEFKNYKKLKNDDEQDRLDERIKKLIEPLQERVNVQCAHFEDTIREYFRYVIIEDCEHFLQKGYMTADEYQKLSETFKLYHNIGGNGQAEEYYHKVCKLDVKKDNEKKGED